MGHIELTTSEVAAVVDQPLHRIQKLIDGGVLPRTLTPSGRRVLGAPDVLFVWILERVFADAPPGAELRAALRARLAEVARGTGAVDEDVLHVSPHLAVHGLRALADELQTRLVRLAGAHALVMRDPEILGGEPVIRGTRISVYLVAAMLEQGASAEELQADYPTLSRDQLELAALYAKASPRPGRPRTRPRP